MPKEDHPKFFHCERPIILYLVPHGNSQTAFPMCGLIIESKLPMPQLPTLNFQFLTVRLLSVDYLDQDRNQIHRLKS